MENLAALEILPRKTFELTLADGTKVQGQFGTWALSRFGVKRKLGLAQIMEVFYKPEVGEAGNVINKAEPQIQDIIDFVLCAIEYKEREAGKPILFNDVKLCKWIDDYSDATGEQGVLMKLFNISSEDEQPDKKKQDEQQNGQTSSEPTLKQEEV